MENTVFDASLQALCSQGPIFLWFYVIQIMKEDNETMKRVLCSQALRSFDPKALSQPCPTWDHGLGTRGPENTDTFAYLAASLLPLAPTLGQTAGDLP